MRLACIAVSARAPHKIASDVPSVRSSGQCVVHVVRTQAVSERKGPVRSELPHLLWAVSEHVYAK